MPMAPAAIAAAPIVVITSTGPSLCPFEPLEGAGCRCGPPSPPVRSVQRRGVEMADGLYGDNGGCDETADRDSGEDPPELGEPPGHGHIRG